MKNKRQIILISHLKKGIEFKENSNKFQYFYEYTFGSLKLTGDLFCKWVSETH